MQNPSEILGNQNLKSGCLQLNTVKQKNLPLLKCQWYNSYRKLKKNASERALLVTVRPRRCKQNSYN